MLNISNFVYSRGKNWDHFYSCVRSSEMKRENAACIFDKKLFFFLCWCMQGRTLNNFSIHTSKSRVSMLWSSCQQIFTVSLSFRNKSKNIYRGSQSWNKEKNLEKELVRFNYILYLRSRLKIKDFRTSSSVTWNLSIILRAEDILEARQTDHQIGSSDIWQPTWKNGEIWFKEREFTLSSSSKKNHCSFGRDWLRRRSPCLKLVWHEIHLRSRCFGARSLPGII